MKQILSVLLVFLVLPVFATEPHQDEQQSAHRIAQEVGNCPAAKAFLWLSTFHNWKRTATVALDFLDESSDHPQGMKKVGDQFFLTMTDQSRTGYLIRFRHDGQSGKELDRIDVTQGDNKKELHPGGLDFDGQSLWIPVAEYRAHSKTTFLKVDPAKPKEYETVGTFTDHIGGVICDNQNNCLRLFNWGTEKAYTVPIKDGKVVPASAKSFEVPKENQSYGGFEYQDGKILPFEKQSEKSKKEKIAYAICGGKYGTLTTSGTLDLIRFDGDRYEPVRRLAIPQVKKDGTILPNPQFLQRPLTYNPMDFELITDEDTGRVTGLRFFFIPHDGPKPKMFVYEAPLRTQE